MSTAPEPCKPLCTQLHTYPRIDCPEAQRATRACTTGFTRPAAVSEPTRPLGDFHQRQRCPPASIVWCACAGQSRGAGLPRVGDRSRGPQTAGGASFPRLVLDCKRSVLTDRVYEVCTTLSSSSPKSSILRRKLHGFHRNCSLREIKRISQECLEKKLRKESLRFCTRLNKGRKKGR